MNSIQLTIKYNYLKVVHCWLKGIHFTNRKDGMLQIYLFYLSMIFFSVLSFTTGIKVVNLHVSTQLFFGTRRSVLMISALDSGSSDQGKSSPGQRRCVVFLGNTLTLTMPLSTQVYFIK